MGWFWSDSTKAAEPVAPHPMPQGAVQPPPECPMHNKMPPPPPPKATPTPAGACPYVPPAGKSTSAAAAAATPSSTTEGSQPPAEQGLLAKLKGYNPLNNMFADLSNDRTSTQTHELPLSREPSTIPKADGSLWEYPSPQQMYNAMLRKGYTDTDVTAVESMVSVHNFLNEGAWAEIIGWERRFGRGLGEGVQICKRGEENANKDLEREDPFDTTWKDDNTPAPALVRFTGRPTEMTPKAQLMQLMARAWPRKFGDTPPPFDRHDWFVRRCKSKDDCKEVRYVIDYYEGQDSEAGEPVFFLDVRPAVDNPTAAAERLVRWGSDVWWRATGGVVREVRLAEEARKKAEEAALKKKDQEEVRRYNN